MLSYIFWDPPKEVMPFSLPFLHRPILWYGVLFALGFFLAFKVFARSLVRFPPLKSSGKMLAEKALLYAIIGSVLGARVVDVLFYQNWDYIRQDPWSIIRFWEGGLASHGGVFGVLLALWFFWLHYRRRMSMLSFWGFIDFTCLPAAVLAVFIRIGNFFNQEILGTETSAPWGVVFGHPVDESLPVPRHPVQLYEACFYLVMAVGLSLFGKRFRRQFPGRLTGWFLLFIFAFRMAIEHFKLEQSAIFSSSWMKTGQILSLPFLVLGLWLLLRRSKTDRNNT